MVYFPHKTASFYEQLRNRCSKLHSASARFAKLVDGFQIKPQWFCTPPICLIASMKVKESHIKAAKSKSKSVRKCQNKGFPSNPNSVPLWYRKGLH